MKTKQEMIEEILNDIRENEYDSRDLLYDLARQSLEKRTKKDLKETYFADEVNQED